ncbi:MAG TPA: ABC transporter substrate-binding protein [Thermomicrobiales bacterium]|nr:ABC transporter substrate-binding protein [Thermomicrobiales bacterium]
MSGERLRARLEHSHVSRRTLLKAGGVALALGAVSPLLAACGDEDDPVSTPGPGGATTATPDTGSTPAPSAPTAAGEDEAQSGGTLTLGYTEPPTMDPRVSGATIAWRLFYNLFDPLIAMDFDTREYHPGLASSWEVSEDGMIYAFSLRDGVMFHDGTPFTAEAVQYTFDSIMDPALLSLAAIGYLGPYDRSEVIDDTTVEVHFSEPYSPFLNNLTHSVLSPVSPTAAEAAGADFGQAPVGTGPFKFKEWQPQISMTFERNPDYAWPLGVYRHEGPAYIDEIVVAFIPEETTRFGTLESGESLVVDGVQPQEVERLQADENYQILLPAVPGSPQILPLNADVEPTSDLLLRQAILYAVDMDTIIDTLWYGTRKAAQGPLSSPSWGYNPAVEEMYPYDQAKAEELLEEAGWVMGSGDVRQKDGNDLMLEYITTTGIQGQAGELVQAYLARVGIGVNLHQLEYAATAAAYLASEHHIARIYFSHVDPVVLSTLYHSRNIPGTNFNRTMKVDPALDEMLDNAASELDQDARIQQYMDIQQYIMDQALMIPLWEETVFWGAHASVKGIHFQPLGGIWFYDTWIEE